MSQHLHIEIPESLLQRLIDRSQAEGITLNELCLRALRNTEDVYDQGEHYSNRILRPGDTP